MTVDRIDFETLKDGRVIVRKFERRVISPKGHHRDFVIDHSIKGPDFNYKAALQWCRENGYTVWTYPPRGARAWKGRKPWPIRTRWEIVKLRRELEAEARAQYNPAIISESEHFLSYDLAYYL